MIYNLGRVVPLFKGNYDAATTYGFLDVVFYDNSSFVALDTTTGNLPTDTTHWLPVALKGITQNPTPAQIQEIISTVETYIQNNNYVQDSNYQHIDIVDNLNSTSIDDALSANQGNELSHRTNEIRLVGNGDTTVSNRIYCLANHTYRVHVENTQPDVSGVSYTSSAYDYFGIMNRDGINTSTSQVLYRRGCDTKTQPLNSYYDVVPVYNGYLIVFERATSGENLNFFVEDITVLNTAVSEINNEINEINDEITEINEKAFNEPLVITDFYKYTTVSSNTSYRVSADSSDFGKAFSSLTTSTISGAVSYRIPIEKGKYYWAKFRIFNSGYNYGCPILDENDLLVGYLGFNGSIDGDRNCSSSPIPSTAAYIIFTKSSNTDFLELYTEDTRETTTLNDALYGREDILYLNSDSTTDIYNFNYLRSGNGFQPSHIGQNIFHAVNNNNFKYTLSGTIKYLIPVKGYDTVQFTTFMTSSNYGSAVLDKDGVIIDTIYRTYTANDYLINPYTLPENAYYIAWTPVETTGIQDKVILKKEKTYEGGSDSGNVVSTPNISFRNGTYSETGIFSHDTKTVVSSFINLGKPFVFQIHQDYCVKHIFMFNGNGELITYYDILPQTGTSYRQRSYDLQLPQYNIVFEIQRVDGEDIDASANIVQFYWVLDDTKVHRLIPENTSWKYFQQRSKQCNNITWKALEKMPQCVVGTNYNNYFFKKGSINHGIPYSEAAEFSKYVGWNVSFKTYLTALLNKRSVAYTENIASSYRSTKYNIRHNSMSNLSSNYYGTVCTGLTSYMTGINNTIVSSNWASISGMSVIACGRHEEGNEFVIGSSFSSGTPTTGEEIANLVQPMDFIWNNGHCSVITDVYLDDDNNRVAIVWTEQTTPRTQSTVYTIDGFIARLNSIINTSGDGYGGYKEWKIYRYSRYNQTLTKNLKFDESDDINTPYINTHLFDYSPTELSIDPDICTYEGDYVAWKTTPEEESTIQVQINTGSQIITQTVLLNNNMGLFNIHRGAGYTKIQIFNEDENRATPPIEYSLADGNAWISQSDIYTEDSADNEDWVIFNLKKIPTLLGAGLYKARLVNNDNTLVSGYTHFEMIDITFNVVKNPDNSYRATFSANGGTPYLIRQEKTDGIYVMRHDLTSTELENGYADFGSTTITSVSYYPFLKLYVQGKYGDVVYRVLIPSE